MDDNNVSNVIPDLEEFQVDFDEVVNVGGGTSDFNQLTNRPKYDGQTMTGNTNIPKVPEKTSELNNDSGYQTGTEVQEAIDDSISQINIPTKTSDLTNDGADGTSTYVEADDLATVATTGSYNDLSNKPSIPTVNDATLTINQNGVTKGTFTANDSDNEICDLTDTTYTAGINVQISAQNEISATDTTYSNFTGTDGTAAGASGLVPAPATTDAGKFLKADGTWDTAGGGGGGDTVYSTKTTSNSGDGGAVYIGGKNANQDIYPDPTVTDNHWRYFWALPFNSNETAYTDVPGNETLNIGGSQAVGGDQNVTIGFRTLSTGSHNVAIGYQAGSNYAYGSAVSVGDSAACFQNYGVALGRSAQVNQGHTGSVALGAGSRTTRQGEVYVGTNDNFASYNSSKLRVIGGVYDGQLAQDAVTVSQVNATIDAINTALSTNIPHIGAAS